MANSSIEWTQMTWNPTTGCTKISSGCKFCYAETMTRRLKAMGQKKYDKGFNIVCIHPSTLSLPYQWKLPKHIFVDSMSDLFHKDVPFEFIQKVFFVMNDNPQHIFQVLTKRADRLKELHSQLRWTNNIWMGVSVEDKTVLHRINLMRHINAKIKFLSCEPLLEDLGILNLTDIHWVIVGGESGVRARPMNPQWVINIQRQCEEQNVAFFFKQWGTWGEDGVKRNKKENGSTLLGKIWKEEPIIEQI
ncbi:MAG: phage Gp37/Gp68 family protein [Odoribacteraceae bacterium]|jgi:protein gp37|nr:phage Gp37/Gp68 family protein [Odoribacteraceae bacterium]